MNKILIIGRIVRDPETKTTQAGIKYSKFTIAVDRGFGENKTTDFIPVATWRQSADFVEKYLGKGSLVSIDGSLQSATYENQDGQKVTRYEVVADRVESLESKKDREVKTSGEVSAPKHTQQAPAKQETKDVPWDLDL